MDNQHNPYTPPANEGTIEPKQSETTKNIKIEGWLKFALNYVRINWLVDFLKSFTFLSPKDSTFTTIELNHSWAWPSCILVVLWSIVLICHYRKISFKYWLTTALIANILVTIGLIVYSIVVISQNNPELINNLLGFFGSQSIAIIWSTLVAGILVCCTLTSKQIANFGK